MNSAPDAAPYVHDHRFNDGNPLAEKNTLRATLITAVMMMVEITGGYLLNSMALLADGWHMSSHALALGLSLGAYALARRLASDQRFAFGTWKIEVLGGYSSALLLAVVAALMLFQSVERLFSPSAIHYDEAIAIAILGLFVNLLCAWLLRDGHHHGHDHGHHHGHHHGHGHHHQHHDHHHHGNHAHHGGRSQHGGHSNHGHHHDINLRSAYLHVIADAATSVLAILALLGGKYFGARWLDPAMGIVGAALVANWAVGLLRQSGKVLLDADMDAPVVQEVRDVVAEHFPYATVSDLHVWRVGKGRYACILALVSARPLSAAAVRGRLAVHEELAHVTVEIVEAGSAPFAFVPATGTGIRAERRAP